MTQDQNGNNENKPQQGTAPQKPVQKPGFGQKTRAPTAGQQGQAGKQKPVGKKPPQRKAPPNQGGAMSDREREEYGKLGSVVVRNEFYRDGYRKLVKLAIVEAVAIMGLIIALVVTIHVHQPENRYFATTEDGRLIPMIALNRPNLSRAALMSWVAQATTEVMTFGFHDYRRRLQEASRNFTRQGWESFTEALARSRIIESVNANQQVVTAAPQGAPILVSEGLVNGRYQWRVEMPLRVTYEAGSKTRSNSLLVQLTIVRVSKLESPNGVGIEQWIAVPYSG